MMMIIMERRYNLFFSFHSPFWLFLLFEWDRKYIMCRLKHFIVFSSVWKLKEKKSRFVLLDSSWSASSSSSFPFPLKYQALTTATVNSSGDNELKEPKEREMFPFQNKKSKISKKKKLPQVHGWNISLFPWKLLFYFIEFNLCVENLILNGKDPASVCKPPCQNPDLYLWAFWIE